MEWRYGVLGKIQHSKIVHNFLGRKKLKNYLWNAHELMHENFETKKRRVKQLNWLAQLYLGLGLKIKDIFPEL